ncbi:MAG: restriction endonuclease FokI C-terminal domain-containing protein, partial [Oscillospiraceae bacterium]
KLLSATEDTHLTKFEIGKQLGFIGEDGFTSMPQKILIQALSDAETAKERNTMKADWEGSSDKYARMISSWLEKLGLVKKVTKSITVSLANKEYCENIGQAYTITATGITSLRKALGKSKHKRIAKNICWEMMATSCSDRDYLRTRRSYILKYISENKRFVTVEDIVQYLKEVGLDEQTNTIKDDINGLINIGIEIEISDSGYKFNDEIKDFVIPLAQNLTKSDLSTQKEEVRSQIKLLSHEYLSLIDLAYDSKQNRLFEMKTLELLTEECNFKGLHLGGSRKPDGLIYTDNLEENYGVIIDTKAYSKGYNLPISQADEMERYIGENQTRDERINPNKWWEHFDEDINIFHFMFVSGHFKGNYQSQIKRISANKGVKGTAIAVINLLLLAELYKNDELSHKSIGASIFNNDEYIAER